MTDLFLTDRLKSLIPKIEAYIQNELMPLEKEFMTGHWNELAKKLEAKREDIKKAGMYGLHLPADMGGMGLTLCEFGQVSELLATIPYGHYAFNCQAPDIGNTELIHMFGTKDQKEKYLKPLSEGKIRSCFSMTEPEFAGSNPVFMGTTAVRENGHFVINGHKWFTSSYDGAEFAIVMAITNPGGSAYEKASMIIVPTDTPGFKHIRRISIMGHEGEGWMSHSEVAYENCVVPVENLLGDEGSGFALAQHRLGPGRIHHCMRWIGISERVLGLMCDYALQRRLNPNEVLADKQAIQHWIAESRADINAARLMVLDTARQIDLRGASAARNEISTIKFFVANIMVKVLDRALQIHGALGTTDDTLISFYYRHERASRIYDGADEVHKDALAKRILKAYAEKKKEAMAMA